ncbi:MAG: excinuclease ABC subunit A, partial [Bacteroidales bacterium]|nr:excinuclease ABC subunit A [Bacteroidales bacterium]
RQFLGRMSKPAVESIIGIPPAIAIEQKVNTRNPRSTVGSTTEIYDYLRTLYAKIGRTISPVSGEEVRCDTTNSVLEALKEEAQSSRLPSESVVYILSDIKWSQQEYRIERLVNLKEEGFSRMYIESEDGTTSIERIDRILTNIDSYTSKNVMLLIDRSTLGSIAQMDNELETSLTDSITTAFNKGNGYITIIIDTLEEKVVKQYSNIFERDGILFETPSEWIFNYNSPLGACPNCGGYGKLIGIDESLVVPNQALSVFQDAIACWKGDVMRYFKEEVILNAEKRGFPIHTPYKELTREQKDLLWNGNKYITGITPFFKELESKRYKIQNKYMISRYSGKTTCRECEGSRLRRESLYVKIGGKDINELLSMSIKDLLTFFKELKLTEYEQKVGERAIREIVQRLEYINDVGLSYLTLNRASNTLSGGESQRISLVKSLGNSLTGSMYILDEPSIGLHSRDTQRLISVIKNLRDLGNTVIVVEHDEEIIRAADYLIDIGPNAGKHGGEVVYAGPTPTEDLTQQYPKSLTLKYLSGVSQISLNNQKRIPHDFIEICDCCENNL